MLEGRGRVPDFEFRGHINMADSKACLSQRPVPKAQN